MTGIAQHSPAPWTVLCQHDTGNTYRLWDGNGNHHPAGKIPPNLMTANARLMAAAPDMLSALELCADCLAELARLDDGTPSISALEQARTAIVKATE